MAQQKVKYNEQQRVDLPDFETVISASEVELQKTLNALFSIEKGVVKGFEFSAGTGLKALLDKSSTRIAINDAGLLLIDEETGLAQEFDLIDDSINYIELTFSHVDSNFELRPFYDIDAKEEFAKEVYTREKLTVTITVNQTGFSSTAIPLAIVTTASGSVSDVEDSRKILFSADAHTWDAQRTDRNIASLKKYINMVASIFKEAKGTTTYLDTPATTLQRTMDLSIAVIEGDDTATFDSVSNNLTCPQFRLLMPNKAFDYTVNAISETLLDKESLYVVLPVNSEGNFDTPTGNLSVQKCDSSSYPNDSKNFLICTRVGNRILFNKGGLKIPDFISGDLDSATIVDAINQVNQKTIDNKTSIESNLNSPLKAHQSTTPDTKLNFSLSPTTLSDGAKRALPPLKSQVFDMVATTIDFQDQSTTGETFDIQWPDINTVGKYRRVGFTLLPNKAIKAIFSDEGDDIASLGDAGILFVPTGLAICYVNLICTDALGKWKTASSSTSIVENTDIYRFGAGSGSGSGSGDANVFTQRLEDRLINSFWEFATPIVYSIDETTLTDETSTAVFELSNGVYTFNNVSDFLLTKNLFDKSFFDEKMNVETIELYIRWVVGAIDNNAVVEVALDGQTFEVVTMEQLGASSKFISKGEISESVTLNTPPSSTISENPTSGSGLESFDTIRKYSAPFSIAQDSVKVIKKLSTDLIRTGVPNGQLKFQIVKDNAGEPTGEVVLDGNTYLINKLPSTLTALEYDCFAVLSEGDYHLIISVSDDYTYDINNKLEIDTDGDGASKVFDGSVWATHSTLQSYSVQGFEYDLRVKITSSVADVKIDAIGILYGEQFNNLVTSKEEIQRFVFSGDDNKTTFEITHFIPNPDRLKAYDVNSGQVYRYGAFNIDGRFVSFPDGMFNILGESLTIIFDQSGAGYFDNSDKNALILASNHLGSTDDTIDKSLNGRGIFLRRPDGTLRELRINDLDQIDILEV